MLKLRRKHKQRLLPELQLTRLKLKQTQRLKLKKRNNLKLILLLEKKNMRKL